MADEVEESPRPGTLAWVQSHDLIKRGEYMLPSCHRIPADASLAPADASTRCRVVSAAGDRCKGPRLREYGLCMGHAGGGGAADLDAMRTKAAAKQRELKITRQLLSIGPRTASSPRAVARMRAAQRASELAQAIVDGPLDDRKLSTIERQTASLKALDATFPLQTGTISMTLEDDPEGMGWAEMQGLASSLLG